MLRNMEIKKSLLVKFFICTTLLVSNTAAQNDDEDGSSESCPDDAWYLSQPPTSLNCTLVEGKFIILHCNSYSTEQLANVTWYWSRCGHNAGVKGTAIELENTSDKYGVLHSIYNFNAVGTLFFQVTDATLGYYWCKISNNGNAVLRHSTITPVLLNTDASLPACTTDSVNLAHNSRMGRECAVEGSPTIYPRVPLPSFCPSEQETDMRDTIFGITLSRYIPITVLAVCGALFIILMLVIMVLTVCLCCKNKQLPKAKQETQAVPDSSTDQVEMVSNNAYGTTNVCNGNKKKQEVAAYETVDLKTC